MNNPLSTRLIFLQDQLAFLQGNSSEALTIELFSVLGIVLVAIITQIGAAWISSKQHKENAKSVSGVASKIDQFHEEAIERHHFVVERLDHHKELISDLRTDLSDHIFNDDNRKDNP